MCRKALIGLSLFTAVVLSAEGVDALDKIVVIGTKTENKLFDLPTQAILIDSDEIETSGANNLSELFENISGLYVSPSGTRMSMRGMSHEDTLYLINGKRLNGEYSKSYELQRIPAGMIERIEILKGSSSLLYGSDAMGGVINIITKKPKEGFGGNVRVTGGKYKKGADLFVSGEKNKTSFSIYANYLKEDAYSKDKKAGIKVMQSGSPTSPSELQGGGNWAKLKSALNNAYTIDYDYRRNVEIKNIGASVSQKMNDSLKLNFEAAYLIEDRDGNYIQSGGYPTNYIQNNKSIMTKNIPAEQIDENNKLDLSAGVDYTLRDNIDIKYTIAYSKYDKDRKIYTPLYSELGYASKKDSLTSLNESTLEYLINDLSLIYTQSENSRITAGAEHRSNDVESTAFHVDNRTYSSLFIQHEYQPIEKLDFVYGGRYDKTSIGEDETSFSFGTTYAILKNTKLKANYSQAFRSPDSRDLYVDQISPSGLNMLGATVINEAAGKTSSHELLSETSDTVEVGVVSKGDNWTFDATLFQTTMNDRISRVAVNKKYMTFKNISDSEIKGIETSVAFSFMDSILTELSYSNIDAQNKTENKKLSDSPEEFATLSISYFPKDNIELKAVTKYTGEQIASDDEKLDSFTIVNIKTSMTNAYKNLDIFAGVNNLLSKETDEYMGLVPEANYYVGVNYKF